MRVVVALGLAIAVALAGVVVAMSAEHPRLAGTNNVFDLFSNVEVSPGSEACAEAEIVPGEAAAVRIHLTPGGDRGGPFDVALRRGGEDIARGQHAGGWAEGKVDVPIQPVLERSQPDVDVCFANTGEDRFTLWGYGAADERRAHVDGERLDQRIRLTYLRPGRESGWAIAATAGHRIGIGRGSLLEGWAFYGWLAALAGTLAAAAAAVLRGRRA